MITVSRIFLLGSSLALLAACAAKPPKPREPHGTLSVKVVPWFGNNVTVYITAYSGGKGEEHKDLFTYPVTGDGVTGFVLPADGVYGVRAFADLDGDKKQGPNEPAASLDDLKPSTDVHTAQAPVTLTLPGTGKAPDWPHHKDDRPALPDALNTDQVKKGVEKIREAAPGLPIPPPPNP